MKNGNLYGTLINEYYVKQFRSAAKERAVQLASLRTREDALHYIEQVKSKIKKVFPFEKIKRTALNAQVLSTYETGNVVCEKILFESLENYFVTGNLYRPAEIRGKLPAVLHLCGHNIPGKINPNGKALNLALAMSNMIVFTVDPLDQGERFRNPSLPESQNVRGHNLLGKRLIGCGSWFGAWRTYDAVRAVDYLLSREEVDPDRVYVTGCSGGGTMTTLLNAVEERFAGAVPSCYITTWKHNVENELPVDAEQVAPGLSAQGLEMADFLIAAAPRPILISGEENDFFDVRGIREAYEDVRRIYALLGLEDRVKLFVGPNSHGYWKEQRESCREFLCTLASEKFQPVTELEIPQVPDDELKVLSVPSVFMLPGAKSADERLMDELISCENARVALTEERLLEKTFECLKIDPSLPLPGYRVLRPDVFVRPAFNRYLLEDEEKVLGVLHFSELKNQPRFGKEAFLYIPHSDYRSEIPAFLMEFPSDKVCCASFDPWMIGEMKGPEKDLQNKDFGSIYGKAYHYAACSLMLDRPLLGICVSGILSALKLLRECGAEKITLIGAGQGSVPALFAAFLGGKELVAKTILVNALPSYRTLFETPNPICPQFLIAPGFLTFADLPDLAEYVKPELRQWAVLPGLGDAVC